MTIDAHFHAWDVSLFGHGWLAGDGFEALNRDFSAADHPGVLQGRVLVQTLPDQRETVWLCALAALSPVPTAVTGWVDLLRPDLLGGRIDFLRSVPGGEWLRALRPMVQNEAAPGWLDAPVVRDSVRVMAERGMVLELLVTERDWDSCVRLVDAVPGAVFVLDHLGKPRISDAGPDRAWRDFVDRLAGHKHVRAKLSGLVTQCSMPTASGIAPFVDYALARFGVHRSMYGSDWPMSLLAASAPEQWESMLERIVGGHHEDIFTVTAATTYSLEPTL
ncbi:MAG TPA: amidohydrolase family protein [Dermatophilaceae bacterium]